MTLPSKHEERSIEKILTSGELKDVKILQAEDSYFELSDGQLIIIDVGIQFQFPHGYFSIGWLSELDMHTLHKGTLESIYDQQNFTEINNLKLHSLVGDKVRRVNLKTLDFEFVVDYTMRTEKEKRFVEVNLEFESGKTLQVSLITYDVETGKAPSNYTYDLSYELLISLNKQIDIKEG